MTLAHPILGEPRQQAKPKSNINKLFRETLDTLKDARSNAIHCTQLCDIPGAAHHFDRANAELDRLGWLSAEDTDGELCISFSADCDSASVYYRDETGEERRVCSWNYTDVERIEQHPSSDPRLEELRKYRCDPFEQMPAEARRILPATTRREWIIDEVIRATGVDLDLRTDLLAIARVGQ